MKGAAIVLIALVTTGASANIKCAHGRLDPNPGECNTFLQCVNGKYFVMPCPSGLHWNNVKKICDWPKNTHCNNSQIIVECKHEDLDPNRENCNSFLQCVHGKYVVMPCPAGLHWNNVKKICDWPKNTHCKGNSENTTTVNPTTTTEGTIITTTKSPPIIDECKHDDLDPNPENCNSFLQCVHGKYVVMPCPAGLHWNNVKKICDWPKNTHCKGNSENTTTVNPTTTTEGTTITTTKSPPIIVECKHEDLDPNPENCNSFLQCVHGKYVVMPCPAGLHWNNVKKICDWPKNTHCKGNSENTTTVNPTTTTEGTTITTTKSPPIIDECKHEDLDPNPENCNSFLQCVHGKYVVMPCPAGLHWNNVKKICDWPKNTHCKGNSENTTTVNPTTTTEGTTITTTKSPPIIDECKHEDLDPNPENCNSFLQCVHGKYVVMPCPEGLHWNNVKKICDWPKNTHCKGNSENTTTVNPTSTTEGTTIITTKSPPIIDECKHEDLDPNPENCNSFLQCVHGKYVVMPCPAGLHWNNVKKICDWPKNTHCKGNSENTTTVNPTSTTEGTTIITTKSPPIIDECKHEDLDPNPENCNSFLQCVHGKYVVMPCPAGLHWNNVKKICDWPKNTHCKGNSENTTTVNPTTTTEGTTITTTKSPPIIVECKHDRLDPNPENCNSFLQCVHGKYVVMPCPEGLHWNNAKKICDWPKNTHCKGNSENTTTVNPTTTTEGTTITTTKSPPIIDECKHEDLDPNPENCNSFLQCVHGKYVVMPCPAGLHWNNVKKICDWPKNTHCKGNSENTTTVNPTTTTEGTTITTTKSPPIIVECKHDRLDPNPENCNSFLQCVHGKYVVMPCPEGLHWNNAKKICDWPKNTHCKGNSENTTTVNPTTTTEGTTITTTKSPPIIDECKHEDLDPNPENCNSFLQCVHGKYVVMPCPAGLHWNNVKKICDWPKNTHCKGNSENTTTVNPNTTTEGTIITTTKSPPIIDECKHEDLDPNPENCNSFLQCVHGKYVVMPCPEGLHWNNAKKICDWPENTHCKSPPIIVECKHDSLDPNPENCNSFLQCVHGKYVVMPCPEGLHWNNAKKICDWPKNTHCKSPPIIVECKHDSLDPNPENCNSFLQCVHGKYVVMPCPEGLHWNNAKKICDWPENTHCKSPPIIVECKHDSLDPNPENCNSFLQCVHGKYVVMHCPEGLHWNNLKKYCDWPINTKCENDGEEVSSIELSPKCRHDTLDRNPDNCNSFLQCVHGQYVVMPCPGDLEWNDIEQICDWSENVECAMA